MSATPSASQLQALSALKPGPLVLFCEYTFASPAQSDACTNTLAQAAARFGGRQGWSGSEQQVLCGKLGLYQHAVALHFSLRDGARGFIESAEVQGAFGAASAVQVSVLSEQPRAIAILSFVLAKVLPHWPFDNATDPSEEPGIGTSIMPSAETIAEIRGHPDQNRPLTMINFLKFRERADYRHGEKPATGRAAYHAYGKVALLATHSLGAKLIFAARYLCILAGNGGDPGLRLWDEFALMQYPGRRTFGQMAQLRRYRKALHHRAAGLAEYGQGLTLAYPSADSIWKC